MVVTVLLVFFMNSVKAQVNENDGKPGSVIYLEGYGNNLTYSLNYEGPAFSIGKVHSMYRIGFGAIPHRYGIPVGLHFLKGRKGKYLDLGVGVSYVNGGQVISGSSHPTIRGEGIFFSPTIGYRRQLSEKGYFSELMQVWLLS